MEGNNDSTELEGSQSMPSDNGGSGMISQLEVTSPFQMTEDHGNNEEKSSDEEDMEMELVRDTSSSSESSKISEISDEPDYVIDDEEAEPIEDISIFEEENIKLQIEDQEMEVLPGEEEIKEIKDNKVRGEKMKINLRNFQATLIENSRDRNSIIYLPTGTGKTRISICSMYYYLCKYGTTKKIVFLANTIQLVKQQAEAIKQTLAAIIQNESFAKDLRQKLGSNYIQLNWTEKDLNNQVVCVHGERNDDPTITKRKRIESYLTTKKQFLNEMKKSTVTVMISQMFLNCLRRGYIKLTDYSFMVFDECHHCGGDHPYSGIMKQFYFQHKKKLKNDQKLNKEDENRLPILMGLTASPVSQPFNDYQRLQKELRNLCINLDSNYSYYPFGNEITNKTQISIERVTESEEKQLIPDLIDYFDRFKDHITALSKIKIHFPLYYQCTKKIIDLMGNTHECLKVDVEGSRINDPQLYLLYDIKECLLLKLRDLWLELGEFAFTLGFHEMNVELSRLSGLRNQQNTKLLELVKKQLKVYDQQFKKRYGHCKKQFMSSKLNSLIDILKPQNEEDKEQEKVNDMVLVFAFKRRTVKYLQMVLERYRDSLPPNQKKFYKSVGVTGYASRQKIFRTEDGHSFQSNPSATEDAYSITKLYQNFVQREKEGMRNRIILQSSFINDNEVLQTEMNRMFYSKMGKMLLEVEQKYNNQIKKLIEFKKKEHRVLITTSVTEEGFDIPGCNLVISFDTPFGMKSYIQIKGRARKKNSKYIIFTNENNYKSMEENKKIYDNTIHAIYELAINNISKEDIDGLERIKTSASYQKVQTKGGALLNTNYSLELLKSYFTSLKPPNRPYFHFIQTTNICFRCAIKFPESSTCSKTFVVGKPQTRKQEAVKSAAFLAVKILKKEGFIRDDLRPSRLEQLEDELEMEKYDDLGMYSKDNSYKEILDRYVMIQEGQDPHTQKKLTRFFFKSIEPQKLEFHNLNRNFDRKLFQANQEYTFQIYLVKFSNSVGTYLLEDGDSINQIGILTCFQKQETEEIFARFKQRLDHTSQEQFELRLIEKSLTMNKDDYERLKTVHNFLLAAEQNNQSDYYNRLNKEPPVLHPQWNHQKSTRKHIYKHDSSRQYYPLMVLLKKLREGKTSHFQIDHNVNKKILQHIDLFKSLYSYGNRPKPNLENHFQQNLTNHFKLLQDTVKGHDHTVKKYLVQCISDQMCFHKGLLCSKIVDYNKSIENQQNAKKNRLKNMYTKRLSKQFVHFTEDKEDKSNIYSELVVKMMVWKRSAKEDLNSIENKDLKIKKLEDQKGLYRFLKQFVLYPVSYPTMLRVSLICKHVFRVVEDHSAALYFRKFYLSEVFGILKPKIKNKEPYKFSYYKNMILDNSQKIFTYMNNAGKSRHLRELGRFLQGGNIFNFSNLKGDFSSIIDQNQSVSIDASMINQTGPILNQSLGQDSSIIEDQKSIVERSCIHISEKQEEILTKVNLQVLNSLKIQQILRALTSKIYRHQKMFNYQEFQFIGDVVLKYLSTLQIFLEKIDCEEGEMHIARANLLCNANLHRAAIRKKLFQYIFTTKQKNQPAPVIRVANSPFTMEEKKKFGMTNIDVLGAEDDDYGYQYIPGKIHADVMEALIGIFYLKNKNLDDCQTLLYSFGILNQPNLYMRFDTSKEKFYSLPAHLANMQTKLKYQFKHKELLVQALTHPSFMRYIQDTLDEQGSSEFSKLFNMKNSKLENSHAQNFSMLGDKTMEKISAIKKHQTFYERMEFLGDAFLDLVVVEYLYDQGGDYLDDEGTLSFLKQSAVSNKTLGFIALKQNFQEYLFIDIDDLDDTMREFRNISKEMDYLPNPINFSKLKIGSLKILGDIFQSLIGAILIDNQFRYKETKEVVMGLMEKYIKHFTSLDFVSECPTFKYKDYLDQNNYKKYKLVKVVEEGIVDGQYLYELTDKTGNVIGAPVRASNDKDAWDVLLEEREIKMT